MKELLDYLYQTKHRCIEECEKKQEENKKNYEDTKQGLRHLERDKATVQIWRAKAVLIDEVIEKTIQTLT